MLRKFETFENLLKFFLTFFQKSLKKKPAMKALFNKIYKF